MTEIMTNTGVKDRGRVIAMCLIAVTALGWLGCMLFLMSAEVTNDTKRQLAEALSGTYADWKPVAYTCMIDLMDILFPGDSVKALYILQIVMIAASVATIALCYMRRHVKYAALVLVLPLFFTEKCMLVTTVGNDELAAASYLFFIAGILCRDFIKRRVVRRVFVILVCGVLAYGMALRQNSVPAVMMLACWGVWKLGVTRGRKIVCTALFFVVSGLVANVLLTYCVFGAEKSYPLRFSLASDITNLSILEGEWHPICKMKLKECKDSKPHEECLLAADCVNRGGVLSPYTMYEDVAMRERDFEEMKKAWWELVSEHPERYMMIKMFFFHSFLLEGRCIPWLCECVRDAYPHIGIFMEQESRCWRAWVNREFVVMSLIPIVCYVMLSMYCMKWFRHWVKRSEVRMDAVVFIAVAFLYTFSFVMLVQSATEQRYYIIRASLCCVGSALFFLSMLGKPRKQERD